MNSSISVLVKPHYCNAFYAVAWCLTENLGHHQAFLNKVDGYKHRYLVVGHQRERFQQRFPTHDCLLAPPLKIITEDWIKLISLPILLTLCVAGNGLTLYGFYRQYRQGIKPYGHQVGLVISDLLTFVAGSFVFLYLSIFSQTVRFRNDCQTVEIMSHMTQTVLNGLPLAQLLLLIGTVADRLQGIADPASYRVLNHRRRVLKTNLAAYTAGLSAAALFLGRFIGIKWEIRNQYPKRVRESSETSNLWYYCDRSYNNTVTVFEYFLRCPKSSTKWLRWYWERENPLPTICRYEGTTDEELRRYWKLIGYITITFTLILILSILSVSFIVHYQKFLANRRKLHGPAAAETIITTGTNRNALPNHNHQAAANPTAAAQDQGDGRKAATTGGAGNLKNVEKSGRQQNHPATMRTVTLITLIEVVFSLIFNTATSFSHACDIVYMQQQSGGGSNEEEDFVRRRGFCRIVETFAYMSGATIISSNFLIFIILSRSFRQELLKLFGK